MLFTGKTVMIDGDHSDSVVTSNWWGREVVLFWTDSLGGGGVGGR